MPINGQTNMLPSFRGIIVDSSKNYGLIKSEAILGFAPANLNDYMNIKEPFTSMYIQEKFVPKSQSKRDRSSKSYKFLTFNQEPVRKSKAETKHPSEKSKRKGKGKKCIHSLNKVKRGNKFIKMHRKYMMPLIFGILAAKSFILPIALKVIAFMSAKGLMMSIFSTILASLVSLKGLLDPRSYQNRNHDRNTHLKIINIPAKHDDQIYIEDYKKRNDIIPARKKS